MRPPWFIILAALATLADTCGDLLLKPWDVIAVTGGVFLWLGALLTLVSYMRESS